MIFATVLLIWILSLCLHEYAHARVAYAGGDHTVADKGYLTLNPFRYMNPLSSIVLPALFVAMGFLALPGGAVWIETWRLRSRAWQSAVSFAGPAANAAMCIAFSLPFMLGLDGTTALWVILAASCFWQAIALVLNLIPIPGLDGWGVLEPWLPREVREWGTRFKPYGFFLIVILFIGAPGFQRVFYGVVEGILELLGVPRSAWVEGIRAMRFWQN